MCMDNGISDTMPFAGTTNILKDSEHAANPQAVSGGDIYDIRRSGMDTEMPVTAEAEAIKSGNNGFTI